MQDFVPFAKLQTKPLQLAVSSLLPLSLIIAIDLINGVWVVDGLAPLEDALVLVELDGIGLVTVDRVESQFR